jgi:hypothetical protein
MPEKRTSGPLIKGSNAVVAFLVDRVGLNLAGAEVLEVRGRTSGTPYRIPVNPVEVDGIRYLFSPRGETGWVKNIRVSETGTLHKRRKATPIRVEEVQEVADKLPVIRAYLDRWGWQVGQFVDLPKQPSDDDILAIADRHPVFRILT